MYGKLCGALGTQAEEEPLPRSEGAHHPHQASVHPPNAGVRGSPQARVHPPSAGVRGSPLASALTPQWPVFEGGARWGLRDPGFWERSWAWQTALPSPSPQPLSRRVGGGRSHMSWQSCGGPQGHRRHHPSTVPTVFLGRCCQTTKYHHLRSTANTYFNFPNNVTPPCQQHQVSGSVTCLLQHIHLPRHQTAPLGQRGSGGRGLRFTALSPVTGSLSGDR